MTNNEAANIIVMILDSMRRNPAQFTFNVNIKTIGTTAIGGPGGPGIVATAHGGGIGYQSIASSPSQVQIQILQGQADSMINQQFAVVEQQLNQLIAELHASTLTKQKAEGFLGKLKETWLPDVVISTIAEIVKLIIDSYL